jgi:hypothetical protein
MASRPVTNGLDYFVLLNLIRLRDFQKFLLDLLSDINRLELTSGHHSSFRNTESPSGVEISFEDDSHLSLAFVSSVGSGSLKIAIVPNLERRSNDLSGFIRDDVSRGQDRASEAVGMVVSVPQSGFHSSYHV